MVTMTAHDDLDPRYLSYMLRMWRTRDSTGQPMWCASLEEPGSHETARFGDMGAMFAFLQSRLGLAPPGERAREEPLPESTEIDGVRGSAPAPKAATGAERMGRRTAARRREQLT